MNKEKEITDFGQDSAFPGISADRVTTRLMCCNIIEAFLKIIENTNDRPEVKEMAIQAYKGSRETLLKSLPEDPYLIKSNLDGCFDELAELNNLESLIISLKERYVKL